MISPERWKEVEALYHAVEGRTPAQRTLLLEDTDPELRREVESLLAQPENSALDRPAWDGAAGDLIVGSSVGPYSIEAEIGAGGMGRVYKARDTRVGRRVAIKTLEEQFSTRFRQEARAIAALNHPNVCTLHDVGPNYLVLELVEGPTLADRIKHGPIPLEETLAIAKQIAGAVEAAHEKGILHRDLKPANIKIRPDGVVKVLDFGLAKTIAQAPHAPDSASMSSESGMILGTAGYMPPEQARGEQVDKRADIWAFGVVLYEMLSGEKLFGGSTPTDTLAAVLTHEPDFNRIPEQVRPLVRRCLEKDPRKRLRDIADWDLLVNPEQPAAVSARPPKAQLWMAAAAVFATSAAAVTWIHLRENMAPDPAQSVRFQIYPPEQARFGRFFQLSPDGKQLVFTATSLKGESMLWIRPLDVLEARPLHGTEGAEYPPFWSPDGRYLAFGTGGKLKKIAVAGGPPQVLCDAPQIVTGGSWSRSGTILFSSNSGGVIWKVPDAGGAAVPVTKLTEGDAYHVRPEFLPDEHHFIYSRLSQQSAARGVYVGSIDAKPEEQESKRVTSADLVQYIQAPQGGGGYLLYLREQALVGQPFDIDARSLRGDPAAIAESIARFSVSDNGVLAYQLAESATNRLTWFDRNGKAVGYTGQPGTDENLALSPDGSRLAVQRRRAGREFDIWLLDLGREARTRFAFNPGLNVSPIWSPDGKQIAYGSEHDNGSDVLKKDADGAGAEDSVSNFNDNAFPQHWSSDGRSLLVAARGARTGDDLWVVSLAGAHQRTLFLQTPSNESQAQFAPDGRWVAYMSDLSGQPEIYVRPFPATPGNSSQWTISTGGGFQPRWRRDGLELFYLSGGRVMAVDISTVPVLRAGVPKVLFEVPIYTPTITASGHSWDVTADGKRFLINVDLTANRASPINVVLNWAAALKR